MNDVIYDDPTYWLDDMSSPGHELDLLMAISIGLLIYVLLAAVLLRFMWIFQGR